MIVKDEGHIIKECLDTVVNHIDYWVISDTGSTDKTKEIITSYFKEHDIPGEFCDRTWVDFGYNRSVVFKAAEGKGDYVLVIDADDVFLASDPFPPLTADAYLFKLNSNNSTYYRQQLFKNNLEWEYKGVLHEYPISSMAKSIDRLDGFSITSRRLGSRNSPGKYDRDAAVLLKGIEKEPNNIRYHFYLAQSYRDAGKLPEAIEYYDKRSKMGGWNEEIFYSLYQKATLIARTPNYPNAFEEILTNCLKAYEICPQRAESLYTLTRYCRETERWLLGYMFGKMALQIPYPELDSLFIQDDIYNYHLLDEVAVCASWLGKRDEFTHFAKRALMYDKLPRHQRVRIKANLEHFGDLYGD